MLPVIYFGDIYPPPHYLLPLMLAEFHLLSKESPLLHVFKNDLLSSLDLAYGRK